MLEFLATIILLCIVIVLLPVIIPVLGIGLLVVIAIGIALLVIGLIIAWIAKLFSISTIILLMSLMEIISKF